ncbi:MAG: hypothetical protein MUC51_12280 [Anaerolineae bacterium]|jgi:uncharacterized protein YnzC (UPF0291/DUF896 family)|nr:hypothetical protein [Anaerolineae bacterium]
MTGPVLCEDCAAELRAAYEILAATLNVKVRTIEELRAEIVKWIDAGNAGTKLINEQRVIIRQQDKYIKWFRASLREAIEDAQLIDNTPDEAAEVRRELLAVLDKEGDG